MKKFRNKKLLSAIAVLSLTGTLAVGAAAITACKTDGDGSTSSSGGTVYYISADGKRDNDGKTIATAKDIGFINSRQDIKAGDTFYLIPGVYEWDSSWGENHSFASRAIVIQANGTPSKNIRFINAALDPDSGYTGEETKVTLDFSKMEFAGNNRGVQIYANYIYWYGIDVCGAGDNGMYIGGSYNTIEYCDFYNNRDSGLQLGRQESAMTSINQWPSYNLIKNCTSHNNYDDETFGENADGFAAKLTIGDGNVFDGCIAYRNSDDGWDLYAKSDSGNIGAVILYNCVAFENGYIEYTQKEMHELLNYKSQYDESNTNTYYTRDGDGNGFKLGGSIMDGDVKMYNCLSFQNRMHGVTDNSNPGYIKVEGVTSYDNSAVIDDDPTSDTFGQVISAAQKEGHGNIDVARQTYSYNTVKNVLSVKSNIPQSLDNDAYRGSVIDSLLVAGGKTNVIQGAIDADTKVSTATQYTSQIEGLSASDVFKTIPVELKDGKYTYNITGLRDSDNAVAERVHDKYRNADHSINMGDILAIKADLTDYLGKGTYAGSTLNKGSWEDYEHFVDENLLDGVTSEVYAAVLKAKETLTLYTEESAVYQDFDVPAQMQGATIEWTTDSDLLSISKKVIPEDPISDAIFNSVKVTRPTDKDTTAKLTAKITYLNVSATKDFEITVKKDEPSIGTLSVRVAETNEVYTDGGKVILDAFRQYKEPVLEVANGAYYNGTLLTDKQYTVVTEYEYAEDANSTFEPVAGLIVTQPGVYKITHKVSLNGGSGSGSMTYQIFVASTSAVVDFANNESSVSVYRDGYLLSGTLANPIGALYTLTSKTALTFNDPNEIKSAEGVLKEEFRATEISYSFDNDNDSEYYIYYAIANGMDEVTSQIYSAHVTVVDISSEADFMKIAGGEKLQGETVETTIYKLTKDLDFTGIAYSAKRAAFTGLLNGDGHTVKNVTIDGASGTTDIGLFYRVTGGTIMNIKFDNIKITAQGSRSGIVASVYGGYFHNIAITNISVISADQRVGGLIGQVFDGSTNTEVSMISVINPIPELNSDGTVAKAEGYYISATGERVGGIIGLIQSQSTPKGYIYVTVSDCYVESYISTAKYTVGSIVGGYDQNKVTGGYLEIRNCVSAGVLISTGSSGRIGGMLGYHQSGDTLRITSCVAVHDMYYGGALLENSQKNQSLIVGNYNTAANVTVNRCVAYFEEYNSDYGVNVPDDITRLSAFATTQFDIEGGTWSYVYAADGTTLAKPYLKLNNVGA